MKIAKFEFSLFGINTYVVWDPETHRGVIVDPGMSNAREEEALRRMLEREKIVVTDIINTHLHVDHAIGNKYAKELWDVPVLANRRDEPLGERMQQQALMFGLSEKVSDVAITGYLEDGDTVKVGNGELKVLAVPGHSQGSIALYDKADGFVITGDALFAGSIGRTDLPGGNMQQLLQSIRAKLLTLPPETVVYPGHGPATTVGEELRSNPYVGQMASF